ncbi:MAG: MarC family protein [Candidatus Micrarchaeia archaeon]|jgi:multiple antibiotic resistance protein
MIEKIVESFIVFLVIMDPFSSLPVFLALTRKFKLSERKRAADKAVLVAALPIIVFALTGTTILSLLGISLPAFRIAGGIVLALMGIQLVLSISVHQEKVRDGSAAGVIIGVPLITGPAVITSTIIFSQQVGVLATIAAAALALAVVWGVLRSANFFARLLGSQGMQVLTRIMGLLLTAIAVSMIQKGIVG